MSSLNYFIYVSSAVKPMSEQEIHDILEQAQSKNARLDVTGLLIHRSGNFIQYIEGPEDSIQSLALSISKDPRHKNFTVLDEGTLGKRQFADWKMSYRRYSGAPIFSQDELDQDHEGIKKSLAAFLEQMR